MPREEQDVPRLSGTLGGAGSAVTLRLTGSRPGRRARRSDAKNSAQPRKNPVIRIDELSSRAAERTNAAGFQAHIVKPVDFGELTELLDRLLTEERAG